MIFFIIYYFHLNLYKWLTTKVSYHFSFYATNTKSHLLMKSRELFVIVYQLHFLNHFIIIVNYPIAVNAVNIFK